MVKQNRILVAVLAVIIAVSLTGCANLLAKMNRLSINMHKDDVRALFGDSFVAKASKVNGQGDMLDLWEYYDKKTKATYQIYFLNNKVSQWGNKDDLQAFPELYAPPPSEPDSEDL
ncbi:MAG: hypothetical protein ABII88_10630 [Candidatus Omnitrophota bacterium]